MWKRKVALVGRSVMYQLWGGKTAEIYVNKLGVNLNGTDFTIQTKEQLNAFAKTLATAWQEHEQFKKNDPEPTTAPDEALEEPQ